MWNLPPKFSDHRVYHIQNEFSIYHIQSEFQRRSGSGSRHFHHIKILYENKLFLFSFSCFGCTAKELVKECPPQRISKISIFFNLIVEILFDLRNIIRICFKITSCILCNIK